MNNNTTIWLDLDGTIADLYSIDDWLPKLRNCDPSPYYEASPLVELSPLARKLNKLQSLGFEIGIISWTSKGSPQSYHKEVQKAKEKWLRQHLPSVCFDTIYIVPYGVAKSYFKRSDSDILIDDSEEVRADWGKCSIDPVAVDILEYLQGIINALRATG